MEEGVRRVGRAGVRATVVASGGRASRRRCAVVVLLRRVGAPVSANTPSGGADPGGHDGCGGRSDYAFRSAEWTIRASTQDRANGAHHRYVRPFEGPREDRGEDRGEDRAVSFTVRRDRLSLTYVVTFAITFAITFAFSVSLGIAESIKAKRR